MAVFLNIGTQLITTVNNSAGIFSGENVQQGWSTTNKNNVGVFTTGQLNSVINNVNFINDPDLIDNPVTHPNVNANATPVIFEGI